MKVRVYKEWVPTLNEDMKEDGYWALTLDKTRHYVDTIEVDETRYDRRRRVHTVIIDGKEWTLFGALKKQRKRTGATNKERLARELVKLARELIREEPIVSAERLPRDVLKEVMEKYNDYRAKWIDKHGSDKGFDAWFTKQVTGRKIAKNDRK
jgi:hypothetical protein